MRQPRALAAVLQILWRQADRRHREDLRLVADLGPAVDDDRRADQAVACRCGHPGRSRRAARSSVPSPIVRGGMHVRRRIARTPRRARSPAAARLPPRSGRPRRPAPEPCARRDRARPSVDLETQAIAGNDLRRNLALLTPRSDTRAVERCLGAIEHEHCRDLRQRLDHEHGRHQRRAGEMSLEELFADGDVLHATSRLPGSCSVTASMRYDG